MARGIDIPNRLVAHYRLHYPANLMRMAIVTKHSLETMTEVVSGLFSGVSGSSSRRPFKCVEGGPAAANWRQHYVYIQSRKEIERLTVHFQIEESAVSLRFTGWFFLANLTSSMKPNSFLEDTAPEFSIFCYWK